MDECSMPRTFSIFGQEWLYRGEGNASLVLALPRRQLVLRLAKEEEQSREHCQWVRSVLRWRQQSSVDSDLEAEMRFYRSVMVGLVGEEFAKPASTVLMSSAEIRQLNKVLLDVRPDRRKNKHLQCRGGATLFWDYALLPSWWFRADAPSSPTYSIELKPKRGCYSNRSVFPLCDFCLHNHVKRSKGLIDSLSEYCPLQLFSGDRDRMRQALRSLLHTPQNNLSIFRDGRRVYGEGCHGNYQPLLMAMFGLEDLAKSLEELCDLVISSVLHVFEAAPRRHVCRYEQAPVSPPVAEGSFQRGAGATRTCDFSEPDLPEGCVLDRIYRFQQMFSCGQRERDAFAQLLKSHKTHKYGYARRLAERRERAAAAGGSVCTRCFIGEQRAVAESDRDRVRFKEHSQLELDVSAYLLSTVACDCSFMVTFRAISGEHAVPAVHRIRTRSSREYAVDIGVFDLFPKRVSCFRNHQVRNRNIYQVCLDVFAH